MKLIKLIIFSGVIVFTFVTLYIVLMLIAYYRYDFIFLDEVFDYSLIWTFPISIIIWFALGIKITTISQEDFYLAKEHRGLK